MDANTPRAFDPAPASPIPGAAGAEPGARRPVPPQGLIVPLPFPIDPPKKPALVRIPGPLFRLMMIMLGFCLWFGASTILHPRQSSAGNPGRAVLPPAGQAAGGTLPADDRPWERRLGGNGSSEPLPSMVGSPEAAPGSGAPALTGGPRAPAVDGQGRKLLGSLVGSNWHVWIYSDPTGPLYTVANSRGQVLAEGLGADDVYRRFPDLPIDRLRLIPAEGALMLADPKD
ncbi:MAG: hypothetical protein JNJ48_06315 [Phycisphaerae bacterium]|nr:hypothetical protein [Phycisphaerae bacterium]